MSKLKVGIIGQGRSGYGIHALALNELTDLYEIAAVSDPDEANRKRAEEKFGCISYADYKELLNHKELDLIVNASPSHLHVPLSEEFLSHGFNVLCEKPLARTVEEVDRLIATAEKAGVKLTTFQQSRFTPAFQQLYTWIKEGKIGRVVQARVSMNSFMRRWDWQTLQENNGGSLLNTGPHAVDHCLQLFGPETMPDIMCQMDRVNTFGDAEDYVKVIMRKPGHPLIDLEISSADAFPQGNYHIQGQYGTIAGNNSELKMKFFDPEKAPKQELIRTPLKNPDGSPAYCVETLPWEEVHWEYQYDPEKAPERVFYKKLYNTLVHDKPMDVTAQHVRTQIAVIEECHRQNPLSRITD